jgi:hypothetical protein
VLKRWARRALTVLQYVLAVVLAVVAVTLISSLLAD